MGACLCLLRAAVAVEACTHKEYFTLSEYLRTRVPHGVCITRVRVTYIFRVNKLGLGPLSGFGPYQGAGGHSHASPTLPCSTIHAELPGGGNGSGGTWTDSGQSQKVGP